MANREVLDRIARWEADGLLDAATAERLRAAEASEAPPAEPSGTEAQASAAAARTGARGTLASFFGPTVSVAEMFAYLGVGFVLAAWHTLLSSPFGGEAGRSVVEWATPAVAFVALALALARGSERMRRAAGVAWALAVGHVGWTVWFILETTTSTTFDTGRAVIATAVAIGAGLVARRVLPSVVTHATVIVAVVAFVSTGLAWASQQYFPVPDFSGGPNEGAPLIDPGLAVLKVILTAVAWIATALVFAGLALLESRSARTRETGGDGAGATAAGRRAAVSRFAAGLAAVLGTTSAVTQANGYSMTGTIWSVEPWIGCGLVLTISAALIAIAFRRDAAPYLYPGAIGVITAFSQLNAQYVARESGAGVALLLEGVILLVVGFGADRVRRRLVPRGETMGGATA